MTWSSKKTYRVLGHHDAAHDTIVVSRSLDSISVPKFIVEYIVFHEMLHVAHPTKHVNGRRYNHTAALKRDEQKFEFYTEAEKWIERNVRKLEREAKRKTTAPPSPQKRKKTLRQLVLPFFGRWLNCQLELFIKTMSRMSVPRVNANHLPSLDQS